MTSWQHQSSAADDNPNVRADAGGWISGLCPGVGARQPADGPTAPQRRVVAQ